MAYNEGLDPEVYLTDEQPLNKDQMFNLYTEALAAVKAVGTELTHGNPIDGRDIVIQIEYAIEHLLEIAQGVSDNRLVLPMQIPQPLLTAMIQKMRKAG